MSSPEPPSPLPSLLQILIAAPAFVMAVAIAAAVMLFHDEGAWIPVPAQADDSSFDTPELLPQAIFDTGQLDLIFLPVGPEFKLVQTAGDEPLDLQANDTPVIERSSTPAHQDRPEVPAREVFQARKESAQGGSAAGATAGDSGPSSTTEPRRLR